MERVTVLVLPGNPGVIGFYETFIDALFHGLNDEVVDGDRDGVKDGPSAVHFDVIGVSHAGHAALQDDCVFTLEDQIEHKLALLAQFFPARRRVVVIGHSIGAWIGLKCLHRSRKRQAENTSDSHESPEIIHMVNLFPTFRHVWRGMAPFVKVAILPGVRNFLGRLLESGPSWLVRFFLSMSKGLTDEAKYITAQCANYPVTMNILTMAHIEAREVVEMDAEVVEAFKEHMDRCHFLYGPEDAYAPREFCEELLREHPDARAELAPDHIAHAFCLHHGQEVAHIVRGYLHGTFYGTTAQ